jgi:glucosyl-3-phosphoglycerate synthase
MLLRAIPDNFPALMTHAAGRSEGRTYMTLWEWFEERSFHYDQFSRLTEPGGFPRDVTASLVLPARNVADTIGQILDAVNRLNDRTGLLGQVVVVDADSADSTADIARARGAEVYSENQLMPGFGPAQGKGDAMWRSLSVVRGDYVMFADADTSDFGEHFVYGTLGPLLTHPEVRFCKAAYRRPFTNGGQSVADGGGRVTELMAKPLLNFFYPELTGFVQPLAGEFAASTELFRSIPFLTGYGVELGVLIDVLTAVGLPALAQVDLGSRQNRHQPLQDLARMSSIVLRAMARRAGMPERELTDSGAPGVWALRSPEIYLHAVATENGLRLDEHLNPLLERPPMATVMTGATRAPLPRRPAEEGATF